MQNGHFKFGDNQITNLEMETAAIYGLSRLLGIMPIAKCYNYNRA
jgi:uridine phosphorylase